MSHETSKQGLRAEWRLISLLTIQGDLLDRSETFDEANLDAALARFDELTRPTTRLENTASRVFDNVWSHYAAGEWDTLAAIMADNYVGIDHRRVVSAETQRGRDDAVRDVRATAEVGFTMWMVSALAIRGERLVLTRVRGSGSDAETIQVDALNVVEVDADWKIAGVGVYDLEDFDSALAELEARYTAGEAAPYANTWSAVAGAYASIGRDELPAMTPRRGEYRPSPSGILCPR